MTFSGWELLGLVLAGVLASEALMPLVATERWRRTLALVLGAALAGWALA